MIIFSVVIRTCLEQKWAVTRSNWQPGSPCVRRWHWASAWAWPWPWSGWWGCGWPGRCCSRSWRWGAPCPRGSRCAGRSPSSAGPGRAGEEAEAFIGEEVFVLNHHLTSFYLKLPKAVNITHLLLHLHCNRSGFKYKFTIKTHAILSEIQNSLTALRFKSYAVNWLHQVLIIQP